jgi:hypothetical protein
MMGDETVRLVFVQNFDVTFSHIFLHLMSIIILFSNAQGVIYNIDCAMNTFKWIIYSYFDKVA